MILLNNDFIYNKETKEINYIEVEKIEQKSIKSFNGLIHYIIKKEEIFKNFDISREDYIEICDYVYNFFKYEERPIEENEITDEIYKEIIDVIIDYLI